MEFHGSAAGGAGAFARSRTTGADAGEFEVVERGAARRVPRLQPECEGSDHVLGVFGASAAGCAGVDAAGVERGAGLRSGRLYGVNGSEAVCGAWGSACRDEQRGGLARKGAGVGGTG